MSTGPKNATTFVHFTDLHIGDPATDPHLHADTAANLRRFVEVVATLDPRPAFVVATGDLTNQGDLASFRTLRRIMDGLGLPVVYTLGNHDVKHGRAAFYTAMLDREGGEATYDHDVTLGDLHVIALDTPERGRVGGTLRDGQFAWLDAALARHPGRRKLLVLHHPPAFVDDPDGAWESIGWAASRRLADLLRGRDVVGLLCGHLHGDRVTAWHGIPVVMSTGPHMAIDPTYLPGGIRMIRATGFAVGRVLPAGLSVDFVAGPGDRSEIAVLPPERVREMMKAYEGTAT